MQTIECKGAKIPALGFGTWPLTGSSGQKAVADALAVGFRHIDTAQMYGNESEVGAAIKASHIDRGDIFVTTKLDNSSHAAATVRRSTEESLRKLGTGYIDLLLIHWPGRQVPLGETLSAMAKLQAEGKVKHLGISNFNAKLIDEAATRHGVTVICNQVEYHPFLSQRSVLTAPRRQGMMLTAYSPIARGRVTHEPSIVDIAKRLNRTPVQVALRWLLDQPGVAAIPKAANRRHIEENFAIFDFELTAADRAAIDKLGAAQDRMIDFPGWSPAWDKS